MTYSQIHLKHPNWQKHRRHLLGKLVSLLARHLVHHHHNVFGRSFQRTSNPHTSKALSLAEPLHCFQSAPDRGQIYIKSFGKHKYTNTNTNIYFISFGKHLTRELSIIHKVKTTIVNSLISCHFQRTKIS